jgi:MEMO1 family protein
MSQSACPRLRPYLTCMHDESDPRCVVLMDTFGLAAKPIRIRIEELPWLQWFDGGFSLRDIHAHVIAESGGQLAPLEALLSLVEKLEEGLYLDGPRFREKFASEPVRRPSCLGCYDPDPAVLRKQLKRHFTHREGPGLPGDRKPDGTLCAALVPHIDYKRGGRTFAWGFKEVFERTDASLFVIIGTSHHSGHRFTLTRKDFWTPLGIVPTDQNYIDRLVAHYGDGLFDDEMCHLPEHSIELEVVFLKYLYEKKREFRIVPLVVGTFQDCVETGLSPAAQNDIGRMVKALRKVEEETNEPVCYLISGDLAHIGPKFEDPDPVNAAFLKHSREKDLEILRQTAAADAAGYFQVVADEGDRRRICGLPPTYTFLEAVRPARGKLLHYDQYVDPKGHESVSFASVAFYR